MNQRIHVLVVFHRLPVRVGICCCQVFISVLHLIHFSVNLVVFDVIEDDSIKHLYIDRCKMILQTLKREKKGEKKNEESIFWNILDVAVNKYGSDLFGNTTGNGSG